MYIEKIEMGSNHTVDYIVRKYLNMNIQFGRINNKFIAIISDRQIICNQVTIEEDRKRPLYKVDMDIRMGKGYRPVQRYLSNYRFTPINDVHNHRYEIYRVTRY